MKKVIEVNIILLFVNIISCFNNKEDYLYFVIIHFHAACVLDQKSLEVCVVRLTAKLRYLLLFHRSKKKIPKPSQP